MSEIKIGGLYKHSKKGGLYRVLGIAHHTEDLSELVVYQAQYDTPDFGPKPIWVRPIGMWNDIVEINGEKKPRFEYVGE